MRIRHAAAAIVAALQSYNFDSFRVAPEAPACEYLCNMRNQHAAAATAAAFPSQDLYNSLEGSEAIASEYLCNMSDLHVAVATTAALGRIFTFIPVWEDVSESASLFFAWTWLSGIVVLCAVEVHEEIWEKFLRISWARGR